MEDNLRKIQQDISSYTGKLFRDHFGKGPETVYVSLGFTFLVIYLRNFITPSEKILLEQDQEMTILQLRGKLMKSISPELKAYIEILTGIKIRELYYDWGFHNHSGMITCISEEPFTSKEAIVEDYVGKKQIDQEIVDISHQAQKAPEEVYSCEINDRTIVVIRNGILVRIEKELIRLGNDELLKRVKRNLEKSYLHNNSHFETILNRRVIDVFVDWDFELDKSAIVFILNPKKPREANRSQVDTE